jgi:hypothetical protein
VCVDSNPETAGDGVNRNGALLYLVQTTSSYAPLAYNTMYEVSCSHCTVLDANGGSVYVDWGTQTCPSSSTLVYTGQAAGAYYSSGGGSNYLCLPLIPSYLEYNPAFTAGSTLYAANYQTTTDGSPIMAALNGGIVPCAVCQRTPSRSASTLIPAATTCPTGFTIDYVGFLASPQYSNNKGEYVCVTQTPSYIGSKTNYKGAQMSLVAGRAPLPIGYSVNYELSCVVCSGMLYTHTHMTYMPYHPPSLSLSL